MTATLLDGLAPHPELSVRHLNTQVSRSLAEKGGKHQARKSLCGLVQAVRLVWLICSFRPTVVYMPLTNSPSFLGFLRDATFIIPSLLLRRQVVIRLHGGYYFYAHTHGLRRKIASAVLGRVSIAMVQSTSLRHAFQNLVPEDRIKIVPNGLDDAPFASARDGGASRVGNPRPRILFVGLMCPEKGFRDVIRAVPLVPDAGFVFMGEWPSSQDQAEVSAFLEEQRASDRVTFAGVLSGPRKYHLFLSSDIFVFPTYFPYEGHAVSSVEALAAGLPIVCTDHGALDESVKDGVNGFFVPRSDPQRLAYRLNQLVTDVDLRTAMGDQSRRLFESSFTLGHFIENWLASIQPCVTNHGTR